MTEHLIPTPADLAAQHRLPNGETGRRQRSDYLGRRIAQLPEEPVAARLLFPAHGPRSANIRATLDPYIDRLPTAYRDILEQVFFAREAANDGTQSARHKLQRAIKALVRVLAEHDPDWKAEEAARPRKVGRPPRNYQGELEAAARVLRRQGVNL